MDDASLYERLLVIRSQLGDEQALGELVAAYTPRLRFYLRKLLGAEEAVDDLLQEVWLAAVRGLPKLVAVEAFRPWLYRIARDQAFGLLRKRRRLPLPLADGDATNIPDDGADDFSPDDIAEVQRALDALPAEQREALVLRFLEDMTYDEIALATGAPVGTVRSRLFYGKQALRARLQGD